MATGIVKKFNQKRGYGLLFPLGEKPEGTDLIFFHLSQLIGTRSVPVGAEVRFRKVRADNEQGVQAVQVELLEFGGRRTLREAEQAARRKRQQGRRE